MKRTDTMLLLLSILAKFALADPVRIDSGLVSGVPVGEDHAVEDKLTSFGTSASVSQGPTITDGDEPWRVPDTEVWFVQSESGGYTDMRSDGGAAAGEGLPEDPITDHKLKGQVRMQWLNEPSKWTAQDNRLYATSDAETDFWRRTYDGGIRDSGHFYFESVVGNFTARVKLTAKYQSRYDQGGLMVRADETTWLKCGIEFMDGRHYASAVVTRDWSDWSVMPIENPASFWIRCERNDTTFTLSYSLDGIEYEMIRQAFLTEKSILQVGLMLAATKGNGFEALFDDYYLKRS